VVTTRQKTGTDVSVPIPVEVAKEILAAPPPNPDYIFWTGKSKGRNQVIMWPIFTGAVNIDVQVNIRYLSDR